MTVKQLQSQRLADDMVTNMWSLFSTRKLLPLVAVVVQGMLG